MLIEDGNNKIFFPYLVQICKAFEKMRPDKGQETREYAMCSDDIMKRDENKLIQILL